jgi:hypothetical protein
VSNEVELCHGFGDFCRNFVSGVTPVPLLLLPLRGLQQAGGRAAQRAGNRHTQLSRCRILLEAHVLLL